MSEYRSSVGEIRFLQQESDFIFPVELWLLNDAINRNNWKFINHVEHREMWAGKPILVAYVDDGRTVGSGHNQATRIDRHGEEYQSFTDSTAERIVGAISDDPADIRLEIRDGNTWTVARGFLWSFYAHELVEKIVHDAQQGRVMELSIEALVTESRMEDGVEVEERYLPLGVTLLGDGVIPAVEGAHIAMLSKMESEFQVLKLRAASYLDANKPKTNNNERTVINVSYLPKKELPALQEKFGENYTVLSAKQEENHITVTALRKSDRAFVCCDLNGSEKSIDEKQLTVCPAEIIVKRNEEEVGCADASDVMECEIGELCDNTNAARDAEAAAIERAEKAENALKKMETKETARRIKASVDAANRQLAEINANRAESARFADETINEVRTLAENGEFVNCENTDGDWIGEEKAASVVRDLCMKKQMELDKQTAEKARLASHKKYAFEPDADHGTANGIEALYNDIVK